MQVVQKLIYQENNESILMNSIKVMIVTFTREFNVLLV